MKSEATMILENVFLYKKKCNSILWWDLKKEMIKKKENLFCLVFTAKSIILDNSKTTKF